MRSYETLFILDPDLVQENRDSLFERVQGIISDYAGILVNIDDWGAKRLAYEIRRKERGHYFLLNYCGEGKLVAEIERFFRIDDRVLKYITVLLEKDVDVDALHAALAEKEAADAETGSDSGAENESGADQDGASETATESNSDAGPPDTENADSEAETETVIE